MTDRAYFAQNWLMRTNDLEEKRLRQIDKVSLIESKLNNCVSSYELTSSRDPISAQAHHEDLLADYATAQEELEKITELVLHEDNITIEVVESLHNYLYEALLLAVHLNRKSIKEIAKSKKCEYKKTQLYCYYKEALEALGKILEQRGTPEKIPTTTTTKGPIVILSEAPA